MSIPDRLASALADRYRLDRELGAGGMATVYLAHDLKHEREVAIKVLHPDLGAALGGERFLAEIKTTAKLQHPHILPLLDSGEADGLLYYVMPYVRGETLRARLQREGPLSPSSARVLLRELSEALVHAHEHGIVHRDVKPENILLSAGHVLVADFGIAKATRSSGALTGTGMSLGTPAYMAPEQAAGDPQTDHRADLYAWGIVAFEVLTGRVPFVGTPQQVMAAHFATPAPDVRTVQPDVPEDLAALIAQCLAKEASARPASAAELVATLGADSGIVRSSYMRPETQSHTKARPGLRVGAAIVAVSIGLAATAYVARGRISPSASTVDETGKRIAVMPLSALNDSSLARLGQDLVVTLSTTLNGVGEIRTVDAGTVLIKARTLPAPIPLADARRIAADLGATEVLSGALTQEGQRVRATVTLTGVTADSVLATASAVAAPTDVAVLTDSLTWSVLRQVWQRGNAPSPVLSGLTTTSIEALRYFLDGEQAFQRLDYGAATAAYRRAFEQDSLFVQPYLRYALAKYWELEPRDEEAWARLLSLLDRLPEREREWVKAQGSTLPVPDQIAHWRTLAARYSDYPPAIMGAGDLIVHSGGWYGVAIGESRPYFERLVALNPGHMDGRSHLQISEWFSDDVNIRRRAAQRLNEMQIDSTASMWNNGFASFAQVISAASRGERLGLTPNIRALGRDMAAQGSSLGAAYYAGVLFGRLAPQRYLRDALDGLRDAGIYRGAVEEAVLFGSSSSRAARGEWRAAVAEALPLAASTTVTPPMRIHPARLAMFGAFLGTIPVGDAGRAVERAREASSLDAVSRVEVEFFAGVVDLLRGDESGVRRSMAALSASGGPVSVHARRVLAGLARARGGNEAGADSLQALSEEVMKGTPFLESAEALARLTVTRRLRQRGQPADVERYLRWIEIFPLEARGMGTVFPLYPLVDYEWALALDAAGKPDRAVRHYLSAIENMDRPDPSLVSVVQDAKRRLEAIDGDAPRRGNR